MHTGVGVLFAVRRVVDGGQHGLDASIGTGGAPGIENDTVDSGGMVASAGRVDWEQEWEAEKLRQSYAQELEHHAALLRACRRPHRPFSN